MRDGLPWIRPVPYPDKDGDIATVLIPCLPWSRCLSWLYQYVSASQPMRASMDSARYYSDVADAYGD